MSPLFYIINTVLMLCLYVIILRLWMQYARVSYYNPCTQFIIKVTQPLIGPLRKIIPSIGRIDTATVVVLYVFALLKLLSILHFATNYPAFELQYLMIAFLVILHSIGHLLFWILFMRAILSWIGRGQSLVEEVLYQLSEPLIAPIRRIVPPIGNIDLSFMIFVFGLIILNMIAMSMFDSWGVISF